MNPLHTTIYHDCKQVVAEYANANNLLEEWSTYHRNLVRDASRIDNVLELQANVSRIRSKATNKIQYGHEVPNNRYNNHNDAPRIDRNNDNDDWRVSEQKEIDQLMEYDTFEDRGHQRSNKTPPGYKYVPIHMVYPVKHDEQKKSRFVAGGHLTGDPGESVYSIVVSLRGVRIVIFLGELNNLKIWQTDIGNAYLEAKTNEKLYTIAGPEFGEKEGHIFVINKALYGLKTSGKRWHGTIWTG